MRRVEYDVERDIAELAASTYPLRSWLIQVHREAKFILPMALDPHWSASLCCGPERLAPMCPHGWHASNVMVTASWSSDGFLAYIAPTIPPVVLTGLLYCLRACFSTRIGVVLCFIG